MAPTIRIDNDVYAWLQSQAKPFEDTPNSVLRRIAALVDPAETSATPPTYVNRKAEGRNLRKVEAAKTAKRTVAANRGRRPPMAKANDLNKDWGVGAKQAYFHRDGIWYNNLHRFPGALFDAHGYIVFATQDDYRNCPQLKIGKELNVPGGISSIPGYVRRKPNR